MATAFCDTSASSNLYLHRFHLPSRLHPQTLFLAATPHRVRRISVAALRPPTPPSPDPPPPRNTTDLASLVEVVSMIQDRVQIFLALLIWISLFFWASALQGRGRGKGKGKKGPESFSLAEKKLRVVEKRKKKPTISVTASSSLYEEDKPDASGSDHGAENTLHDHSSESGDKRCRRR